MEEPSHAGEVIEGVVLPVNQRCNHGSYDTRRRRGASPVATGDAIQRPAKRSVPQDPTYDVTRDGRSFLVLRPVGGGKLSAHVIANWDSALH